jgi:uncharacterized phage-like protein YoqJ
MILGVSGHRPYTWNYDKAKSDLLQGLVRDTLLYLNPNKVITGMAIGFDQEVALACYKLRIPYIAAVPFEGQDSKWPNASKRMYAALLKEALEVIVLSKSSYDPSLMKRRNAMIVNQSDAMMVLFNGEPSSGTGHTVDLAKAKNLEIHNLWPKFVESWST